MRSHEFMICPTCKVDSDKAAIRKEIAGQILWFESLEETIEDGDVEVALLEVQAAIKLLKRLRGADIAV